MRSVVLHSANDLRVEDRPVGAGDDEREGPVRIAIERGGICGSDLHYWQDGGFGTIVVREPLILGHEVAGRVIDPGGAEGLAAGDLVAISPSRPCGTCRWCREGLFNHCLDMRFYGSAMPMPHVQGAFRDEIRAEPHQLHVMAPGTTPEMAAFAEPLSVVLHAARRAGELAGRRVLVTGCGPIGALAVAVARHQGAAEVVVTDRIDAALAAGRRMGADRAINVAETPGWTADYSSGKGSFDVMIEASGAEAALRAGLEVLRPRAVLVQLGLGGEVALPQTALVAREIELRGSFRFHEEFAEAVALINHGAPDLEPLLSAVLPADAAAEAFALAADRRKAMKVQLDFTR